MTTVPDVALLTCTARHRVRVRAARQVEHVPVKNPLLTDDIRGQHASMGRMYSSLLQMDKLFDNAVVISNLPFLPPSLTQGGRPGAPRKT
jgi:hypothetical protein